MLINIIIFNERNNSTTRNPTAARHCYTILFYIPTVFRYDHYVRVVCRLDGRGKKAYFNKHIIIIYNIIRCSQELEMYLYTYCYHTV